MMSRQDAAGHSPALAWLSLVRLRPRRAPLCFTSAGKFTRACWIRLTRFSGDGARPLRNDLADHARRRSAF